MTNEEVIARLRESKRKVKTEHHAAGVAAGTEWAREYADFDDLERLEQWQGWPDTLDDFDYGDVLAEAVCPDNIEWFWEHVIGDDWNEPDGRAKRRSVFFLEGFVEGAIAVWKEVKAAVLA